MKKTDTPTLIKAMRILARDIQSGDGVANAAIAEAADRLEEQSVAIEGLMRLVEKTQENQMSQIESWRELASLLLKK